MNKNKLMLILNELQQYAGQIRQEDIDALVDACLRADRIFVAGAGRSGFMARGFANRLLHLNLPVHYVGETTTPPIHSGDLLIICSGSGETASLKASAEKAKAAGASIATLTMAAHASIAAMADVVVLIPGSSPKAAEGSAASIQPMGSLFEQLSGLTFDAAVLELMERTGETGETMFSRHANLE